MKQLAFLLALIAGPISAEPLRIATGGHYPPYIFDPETPVARGLDKDLLDEICARGAFECTWVDLPMGDIFQALARGDVDVVTGGFGYSNERDAIVDFTCPYVTRDDSAGDFVGTREGQDLINARIGTLDQSLYQTAMLKADRTVFAFATEEDALAALVAGEIDVVFGSHNMSSLAAELGGFVHLGEYPTFSGGSVLGVAEDAPDLRVTLDQLLADMSADGTLGEIQMRWLGRNDGDVIARCQDIQALT